MEDLKSPGGIRRRCLTFIGDLFPAALAAWLPWRGTGVVNARISRPPATFPSTVPSDQAGLPRGLIALAPETQAALAAASGFARSRGVTLQMAVEQGLVAQADAVECQACLRHLILGAIGRADSSVLVTAMRQPDGVEIAVLDDGAAPAGARPDRLTQAVGGPSAPLGGTLRAEYQPERGTTVLLRLPQPGWLLPPSDADAAEAIAAAANI
jgi:hypothetical protein